MKTNEILDDGFAVPQMEVYDQFFTPDDAKHLISVLQSNDIEHKVETPKGYADTTLYGDGHSPKVFVRVHLHDFQRVNQLMEADMLRLIQENKINLKKHYLNEFSNDELLDVLHKPDEWSFEVTVIAKHLLEARGVAFNADEINQLRAEQLQAMREPKKGSYLLIFVLILLGTFGFFASTYSLLGYFLIVTACLGMGYYFMKDMTIDSSGNKFLTFDQETRNYGFIILVLTAVANLAFLVYFFVATAKNL